MNDKKEQFDDACNAIFDLAIPIYIEKFIKDDKSYELNFTSFKSSVLNSINWESAKEKFNTYLKDKLRN